MFVLRASRKIHTSASSSLTALSEEHVIHLILNQNTPSLVLQTFRWASKFPGFSHTQSTYRVLFKKLCVHRRFDVVYKMLDEMPQSLGEPPADSVFVTIINGLGKARRVEETVRTLELVNKFGKSPSLTVLNSILHALVGLDIDVARDFYWEKMVENGNTGDDYTFGILMKGLCSTNKIGEAFSLIRVMKSRGVNPNTVVYNTLISALCKRGKVDSARTLFNNMVNPNDSTFNILISAHCKQGNLVQSYVMLEKSFDSNILPSVITVTKLIEALCESYRPDDGLSLLRRYETKGGKADVVAYNTLIEGFCRANEVRKGCCLVNEMETKGVLPTVQTYNTLLAGACRSNLVDLALDIFSDMETAAVKPDFRTYDVVIKGLCANGRTVDALRLLKTMEESGGSSRGRISPYNSIVYGLYRGNKWDEAIGFLIKMKTLFPRSVGRSFEVFKLCERGEIEEAMRIFGKMKEEGGSPSVVVYDCLIHGLCEGGRSGEALEMVSEMVEKGEVPLNSTLKAVEIVTNQDLGSLLHM